MYVEFMELQKVMASCNLNFSRGQKCFPNSTDTDKTTMKQMYFLKPENGLFTNNMRVIQVDQ